MKQSILIQSWFSFFYKTILTFSATVFIFTEELSLDFLELFFNAAASAAPQIPLCPRMLGLNQGLLRRWH
jgi:hypothetical protein